MILRRLLTLLSSFFSRSGSILYAETTMLVFSREGSIHINRLKILIFDGILVNMVCMTEKGDHRIIICTRIKHLFNPFPHTTILQQTTLNIFCQTIENIYNQMDNLWIKVENIVSKGEIARFERVKCYY